MRVARLFVTAAFLVPQAASFVCSIPPAPASLGFIPRTRFIRFRSAGCPFLLCSPAVALRSPCSEAGQHIILKACLCFRGLCSAAANTFACPPGRFLLPLPQPHGSAPSSSFLLGFPASHPKLHSRRLAEHQKFD
jgi:hypothetical protein